MSVHKSEMILPFNVGTEVGTEYRWPYDSAHPDCWREPWKGVVLAPHDPRAWTNTVRFPGRVPRQAEVVKHLADLQERSIPLTGVPVLWDFGDEQRVWREIAEAVAPYQQCLLHWRVARATKRGTYKPVFRVNEYAHGIELEHVPTGETHWLGDGVDTLFAEDGQAWTPGSPGFREAWEFIFNDDSSQTYEAYFPSLKPDDYDAPVLE